MRRALGLTLVSLAALGCGESAAEKMGGGEAVPVDWPARDAVETEVVMGAGYAIGYGDWRGTRAQLKKPTTKKAVDDFVAAPLPEAIADRTADKADADAKLKALMTAAGGKASNDELKTAYDAAAAAVAKLRTTNG